jgi:hypothetical protein
MPTLRSGTVTAPEELNTNIMTGTPATIVKKKLSRWALQGLDISEAGFSKLHSKESHFEKDGKHYDLNPESFKTYRDGLIEKIERMFAKDVFNIKDVNDTKRGVLKEYTRLTEDDVKAHRDAIWTDPTSFASQTEADVFTDIQLKSSTIGSYINESLEAKAKAQLKSEESFFKVEDSEGNSFFDGPSYFFKITEIVDPDNGQLIDDVKRTIRSLHIKDFGYSAIKMLAEFKNLKIRVEELGGTYSEDETFFDFWQCIETMKEEEFRRYVKNEKDIFSETPRSSRDNLDKYIKKFSNKEVRMRTAKEWNVMSSKDTMVMALVSMLDDQKSSTKIKKHSQESDKENERPPLTAEEREQRREARIPDWKKIAPKGNEPTKTDRGGRTYHWCSKCRDGKGMWSLHPTEEHKKDFKSSYLSSNTTSSKKDDLKTDDNSKPTKKVSFKATSEDKPSISVKKDLLSNAKAYLAQFDSDFGEGGSPAE